MSGRTRYERVTYRPEGADRSRSVLLENPEEGRLWDVPVLSGLEVGKDGETRWFDGGTTARRHLIQLELIVKRTPLVVDNELALLVEPAASA